MASLKLLHISDLHIGEAAGADYLSVVHGDLTYFLGPPALLSEQSLLARALEAKMDWANWVLVTGDMSHTGRIADLKEAASFINSLDRQEPRRLALVPGNHDRFQERGPYPAGANAFDLKFLRYWDAGRGVHFRVLSDELRVKAGFADFSLREEEAGRFDRIDISDPRASVEEIRKIAAMCGQGCAYEDILKQLHEETAQCIRESWKVVWVIHFAPFPPKLRGLKGRSLKLQNEKSVMDSAASLGISHIFCGHTHILDHYVYREVEIFCSGRALRNKPAGTASILAIELDVHEEKLRTLSWKVLRRYKESRGYVSDGANVA